MLLLDKPRRLSTDIDIIVELLGDEVEDVIYSYKALRDVKQGQPSKGLKYKVLRPKVVFLSAAFGLSFLVGGNLTKGRKWQGCGYTMVNGYDPYVGIDRKYNKNAAT